MARVCPITTKEFLENAKPVKVIIGDREVMVDTKQFSTGSLGWYDNGKTKLPVGGVMCDVQIGLNLTIIGSKELPKQDLGGLRQMATGLATKVA